MVTAVLIVRARLTNLADRQPLDGVQSALKGAQACHGEFEGILDGMFQELPLRHGYALLGRLRESGWTPPEEDRKALFEKALAVYEGEAEEPAVFVRRDRRHAAGFAEEVSEVPVAAMTCSVTLPDAPLAYVELPL